MATKYWIKLYHETLHDPKVARLPDNLWRRFIECLLFAGEENNHGRLPQLSDISWTLQRDEETLVAEFDQLARYGLLDHRTDNVLDNGYWLVVNFGKRQMPLSKADYMQRLREERQTEEHYGYVTKGNAEEDTDKDKEEDKEVGRFSHFSTFFVNISHINELTGGAQKWVGAIRKWVEAGLEEQDIQTAYNILIEKDYTVTGPWSVTNTAIGVMTKRKADKAKVMADIPTARTQ